MSAAAAAFENRSGRSAGQKSNAGPSGVQLTRAS
jgi:hypothetical protein